MEETLNIDITEDYAVEINRIDYHYGFDYTAVIRLKLSDKSLNNITSQIKKSPFFNLKHDFYSNNTFDNEYEWQKRDTLLYWKVRSYLEKEHLAGYWIKKDEDTYEFCPVYSDITNFAILFQEGFDINAWLSLKDKTLNYKYTKY